MNGTDKGFLAPVNDTEEGRMLRTLQMRNLRERRTRVNTLSSNPSCPPLTLPDTLRVHSSSGLF